MTVPEDVAVNKSDPPVSASYHRIVLAFTPSVGVILPDPQKVALAAVGAPGTGFIVMLTGTLAAVLSQPVVVL